MIENKKVITGSLIILFLILAIVYSLTYQKKQSLFKASNVHGSEVVVQVPNQNYETGSYKKSDYTQNVTPKEMTDSVSLGGLQTDKVNDSSSLVNLGSVSIKTLPGTTEYFGTLDIVGVLGQKPKFTLQDAKGNYFAYYGDKLDFKKTIQTLGGNVYEMVTESEILGNQLFGDRVSYINLSMFKDVWVIMVIEIDEDIWLLQIPADKYHYSKEYLKSLFIQ